MGVIPCERPAHNGEAHTGCLAQGEAIDGGQCRGKPSAGFVSRYGPVTTDPYMGEAPVTVTPLSYNGMCGKSRTEAIRGLSVENGRCSVVPFWVR